MDRKLHFHFVRHVPVINPDGVWYGRDIPFDITSPQVIQRFNDLACTLPHDPQTSKWITSSYPRAQATAQGVWERLSSDKTRRPIIHTNDHFIEQQYGIMEGRTHGDVKQDPRLSSYFTDMWTHAPEHGESMQMLQTRVAQGLNGIIDDVPPHITDVVIFAHGGVIMAAFAHAAGKRMIDVFRSRAEAETPSFSYSSALKISFSCDKKIWLPEYLYETGIRKPA